MTNLFTIANDNGHDDAVDGNCFTEDDADKVLRTDARRLHTTAQNTWTSRQNAPVEKFLLE